MKKHMTGIQILDGLKQISEELNVKFNPLSSYNSYLASQLKASIKRLKWINGKKNDDWTASFQMQTDSWREAVQKRIIKLFQRGFGDQVESKIKIEFADGEKVIVKKNDGTIITWFW